MKLFRQFDRLTDFLRKEDGSFTIEAVIWMPVFALLLALLADTSLIFGDEASVMKVVQDTNRSLSVGHFQTMADAETYLQNQIAPISPNATVTMSITNGIITTIVAMPTSDLTATGLVSAFSNATLYVKSTQMSEA